jgi:1-acyl-sn-glycerol-3-phosphate acyltransferase
MKNIFVNFIYSIFVRPWLTYIIGVSYENAEALQESDQFIIVANHNSHFDIVSIMAILPRKIRKNTCAVATGDYFGKERVSIRLVKLFFNAILVYQDKKVGQPSPCEILDQKLKEGKSIIILPEGSRGEPDIIGDFKKGVAILLKKNPSIPYIPVYLDGFARVLPKNKILIVPLICKVKFGTSQFSKSESIESILEEVKQHVLDLKPNKGQGL